MVSQESGTPGGFGAVARRGGGGRVVEAIKPTTYGVSGGYYTDSEGRQISQQQAQASGRVDQPGAAAEKIRSIGGGATTTQIEQRMGIEEARKRGEITRQEAITLTQQNIEGRPLELIRQVTQQEQQRRADVAALQEFRERTGALSPVGRGYREATQREITQLAPERVYVKLNGRNVPFVSREKAEQTRPMTQLQRKAEQSIYDKNVELSNILKYDIPGKIPKPITNFFDAIDKRAKLSFQLEKPPGALKIHYLAENIYDVVKGMKKGVVEQPLTAGASLVLGGALAKGAGVLAARVPLLTRGVSAGRVGSKISALNVAGGAMAGYYGADVAKRIAAADNRNQEIGKILSTEIVPFVAGARIAQAPIAATARDIKYKTIQVSRSQRKVLKEFIKDERARVGADVWSKIPTQRQSALARGEELKRTIQFGKTFAEPTGKGVTVVSGKQQLIAIQETKLKPPELKQVQVTAQRQATKQLQQQIQITKQEQVQVLKQLQKTVLLLPMVQRQKVQSVQKDQQVQKQVQEQKQVRKQIYKQFTPQLLKIATSQMQSQQQKSIQEIKQVQRQVLKTKQITKQVTKQVTRQIQKKKVKTALKTFDEQIGDFEKARKKRGKFVWNVRNQIPTLESLIG